MLVRCRGVRRPLVRYLSAGARVGVLHVYKLEPTEPVPGSKLRLLLHADDPAKSAAQLAEAAERGEAVLVPESVLPTLAGHVDAQLHIDAGDHRNQGTQMLTDESVSAESSSSSSSLVAPTATDALALALAEHMTPLSQMLASGGHDGLHEPDWRSTEERASDERATGTPTALQQAVLSAAASGDAAELAEALAACPPEELARAALPPSAAGPLHLAATAGATDAVRMLLQAGCPVDAVAGNGSTALHWAAGGGHEQVVRQLLAAGASTRLRSSTWRSTVRGEASGQTPAHWAAASGHTAALEVLLSDDPHALMMEDERQMAPAAVAAKDGHPWLRDALGRLQNERVVCVNVHREVTLQRPLGEQSDLRETTSGEAVLQERRALPK
jgi:hypothetical protein